jgi:CHAT domain/Thiolase, C-terminal domain
VFEGGTFGLVRAWYHVGASQIVMSLWNIDDNATKDLMLEFMRHVKAGAVTEFAQREAMLATRQKYTDPVLWAVLTTRLLHAVRRDGVRRGMVTLCIGGGQGIALALEAV